MTLRELTALGEGQVTLRQYGDEVGRTLGTLWAHWRSREGFPAPVGVLRIGRRQGGGRPEPVYSRDELNQFRASQPDLWGRRRIRLIVGHGDSEQVTLAEFADLTGITVPDPDALGCPAAGPDGLFRLGDLAAWQNTRPASAGPELALTRLGPGTLVTLGGFARLVRRDRKTVTQYRGPRRRGLPAARTGQAVAAGNPRRLVEQPPGQRPPPGYPAAPGPGWVGGPAHTESAKQNWTVTSPGVQIHLEKRTSEASAPSP